LLSSRNSINRRPQNKSSACYVAETWFRNRPTHQTTGKSGTGQHLQDW
jgi:hypothetical protein